MYPSVVIVGSRGGAVRGRGAGLESPTGEGPKCRVINSPSQTLYLPRFQSRKESRKPPRMVEGNLGTILISMEGKWEAPPAGYLAVCRSSARKQ